jgi:hypothetical protein
MPDKAHIVRWVLLLKFEINDSPDLIRLECNKHVMDNFWGWSACFQENVFGAGEGTRTPTP